MRAHKLLTYDNYPLSIHIFDIENPKAIVQIVHGMEEHQERYENFAHFLNQNGYCVLTTDLRGHGNTAKTLGHFDNKKGYDKLVNDQIKIRELIETLYPDCPVFLFSHSMGTIISRVLLQSQSKKYNKVVFSGYPNYRAGAYFGLLCSSIIKMIKGPTYKSKLLQNLSVGVFNKAITNPSTDVDWICHNTDTVKSYIDDPFCGIGFTCSAFNDLYHLVIMMHQPMEYKNVNENISLLMLRGLDDPCTGGSKGARDSYKILSKAGFKNITNIDYPNMRHEILNELNSDIVYNDILEFFKA